MQTFEKISLKLSVELENTSLDQIRRRDRHTLQMKDLAVLEYFRLNFGEQDRRWSHSMGNLHQG